MNESITSSGALNIGTLVMNGDIRLSVRDEICSLCEWKNLTVIEGNVRKDHIHIVLEIPPDRSVSNFARLFERPERDKDIQGARQSP
ncbi:MAG: transposase [Fibrobacteraceae bacterium]|nr:transposase [Fibrobacteraceae bacterium]